MSGKTKRAHAAAERLRAAFTGTHDDELAPVLASRPPVPWVGVDPDIARGAAVLAGLKPTSAAIQGAVAPEVVVRTVTRWLDPEVPVIMPWGSWVALRELARAAV